MTEEEMVEFAQGLGFKARNARRLVAYYQALADVSAEFGDWLIQRDPTGELATRRALMDEVAA